MTCVMLVSSLKAAAIVLQERTKTPFPTTVMHAQYKTGLALKDDVS